MEINFTGNSAEGYTNTPQAQRKPVQLGPSTQGDLQRNTQRMNPFSPNNGNPRGANNMPSYENATSQGAKPMPGGYQQSPPLPQFGDYGNAQDFASAIRMYNQSGQRSRFDPAYGILPSDSGTAEDRELMGLPTNAYQNMYTTDGRVRFDQLGARLNAMLQGRGAPPSGGGRPTPQGYWDQGQNPEWGRYIPPMMQDYRNPQSWYNQGGYNYNLPGAAGQFPTLGGFLTPPTPNNSRPPLPYPGG